MFSLWSYWGNVFFFGEETTEEKCHSHCTISRVTLNITTDVYVDQLTEVVFVGFSTVSYSFFLYMCYSGRKSLCTCTMLTLEEWVLCSTSLRWSNYIYCLEFWWKICLFSPPPPFYSFNYLYQYELSDIYLLLQYYFILWLQLFQLCLLEAFSVDNWIPLAFDIPLMV